MAATYTKRLYRGTGVERGASGAVPAGKVWVVRCIDIVPGATTATSCGVGVSGGGYFFYGTVDFSAAKDWLQWTGRQVLEVGESLNIYGSQPISCYITGYELIA